MGVNRQAERHRLRRSPPPEREAGRWVELVDDAGRTFWLDAEIWTRPVPVRTPDEIPAPLAEALAAAARRGAAAAPVGPPPSLRFLHEALFFELRPEAVGLTPDAFAAVAPALTDALRAAGCAYVETED